DQVRPKAVGPPRHSRAGRGTAKISTADPEPGEFDLRRPVHRCRLGLSLSLVGGTAGREPDFRWVCGARLFCRVPGLPGEQLYERRHRNIERPKGDSQRAIPCGATPNVCGGLPAIALLAACARVLGCGSAHPTLDTGCCGKVAGGGEISVREFERV